jgi:hypothetical protein
VDNEGRLIADGGTIAMHAQVVNQNGFIQANSVRNHNGVIELVASDQLNLGADSQIIARGDNSPAGSTGGTVTLQSANNFSDNVGSQITVTGGTQGGDGGAVEISAPNILSLNSQVDAGAQTGWSGGVFALDPINIVLGNSGSTMPDGSGTIDGTGSSGTLKVNVNTAFQNITAGQILLEASGNITLNAGTTWDLYASTGNKTSGLLTLEAGGNIVFGNNALITDDNDWSVMLEAGYNFTTKSVVSTVGTSSSSSAGNIYLNGANNGTGSGSIQTGSGWISLEAGNGIQIGSGTVSSSAGNVTWQAGGNIQLGDGSQITDGSGAVTLDAGYNFATKSVVSTAGTSSSASAGNIYLNGGNNGTGSGSIQTGSGSIKLEAGNGIQIGSGTVSSSAGDVTWRASGDIQMGDGSQISDGDGAVTLEAGYDFVQSAVQPGVGNIYLNGGLAGDGVGGSIQTAGGSINLEAGQDIQAGSGSLIDNNGYNFAVESGSGSITLSAGQDIQIVLGTVATLGGGGITATAGRNIQVGFGSIATLDGGDIAVTAGQDIQVGSGSITTVNGGNITATATAGSVITGTDPGGYIFNSVSVSDTTDPLYQVVTVDNPYAGVLGGISTAAGGNVKITAGLDIISLLPQGSENSPTDAGSGAFGPEPGNVTLSAGRNVVGHYVVANGTGTINAGVNAGTTAADPGYTDGDPEPTPQEELALSLINGNWTVQATHDINLQEVRNPNGIFNEAGNTTYKGYHLFDYAPGDSVTLNAGNSVQLLGDNVPRNSDESPSVPIIYPSILNITAGAGGVILGANVILFPSAQGSLNITTTGGGSFESQANVKYLADLALYANGELDSPPAFPDEAQFIMSDSSRNQYIPGVGAFGASDHAATPVHFNNPTTVALNLSGDMDNIELVAPEAVQINVAGNMNNCSFIGQNLNKGDVTTINVGGDILNQSAYSSVPLASPPDLSKLNEAYINGKLTPLTDLLSRLQYNPTTGLLTFQGRMSPTYEGYLKSLTIQTGDQNGNPILKTVQILDSNTADKLYQESLNAPAGQNPGYFIGGGGQFNINARNVNLGSTLGIRSIGPENDGSLATVCHFTQGADINLNLTGYLDIFSTTICALNGGNITINAVGYVNVGLKSLTGNDQYVRGIFTVGPGNVSVVAGGDINVNGSRIAAYDGGNVFVESTGGSVDAGSGSSGSVAVEEIYVDPVTYQVYKFSPTIPLSGILAMTFPPRGSFFPAPTYTVGNILVETPNGNITANAAGIVQLPLNGGNSSSATVVLLAGEDINGNVISQGRNIDLGGSAVVGSDVTLKASGDIKGVVFARNNANVSAQQNVNVTVLAEGTASVSGGGDVSGTIIGVGGVSASGSSIDANLESSGSISGNTSGQKGLGPGTAADAASQGMATDNSANPSKNSYTTATDDDEKKKKGRGVALMQKTGRVTVLLPPKHISQNQTSNAHL